MCVCCCLMQAWQSVLFMSSEPLRVCVSMYTVDWPGVAFMIK